MTAKADMPEQNTSNRVWDIIEQLGLCMVTTIREFELLTPDPCRFLSGFRSGDRR
jgi:hypothetical protein